MAFPIKTADSSRTLPILVLGYAVLMMHYVFSRAFRDSLLGSHLEVSSLPALTVLGTLLAITLSIALSFFVRSNERIVIIRCLYALNAVIELMMAFFYRSHDWVYSAYYIGISASTALGLSLIWILIGDWTSHCNENGRDRIPLILICGTSAGMFGGLGLVHIPGVLDFGKANMMLAGMHFFVAGILLFYSDEYCVIQKHSVGRTLAKGSMQMAKGVVKALAAVAVLGAATSTLLDLTYRVSIAETYTQQAQRLHYLGTFHAILSLGALLSQVAMNRLQHLKMGIGVIHIHPAVIGVASCLSAIMPTLWLLGSFRVAEYSLRNSTFRTGVERTYITLPDEIRVESRPLIDVVGERLGDMAAAGMLQLLLLYSPHLSPRPTLFTVAGCSLVLFLLCRVLEKKAYAFTHPAVRAERGEKGIPLHGIAKENSVLV